VSTLAHTVTRSVVIEAPPTEVWESITDEAALSAWLAPEVELEPHEGGEIVCREGFGPSQVELIVDAVAEGTRLTVVETSSAEPTLLASSWTARLGSLRLSLGRLVLA
jgi:uncharacterized protein YndB with AHSA1/START domain